MQNLFHLPFSVNLSQRFFHIRNSKYWWAILFWPAFGMLLCGALWFYTQGRLAGELEAEKHFATQEAIARAEAYSNQFLRTIEHIDHVTLSLKYAWEVGNRKVDLEKQRTIGLFPDGSLISATLMDKWGDVVSTTISYQGEANFADTRSFQDHRQGRTQGLIIEEPTTDPRLPKPVIRFSRRLENPDGSFDGVVVVSADPVYFMTFRNEESLVKGDFMSLRFIDGALLAAKSEAITDTIYRVIPVFSSASGAKEESRENFYDNQARIVAWNEIDGYPLVAIAAISEQNALAAYKRNEIEVKATAVVASLFILISSLIALYFSFQQTRRKEHADEIKNVFRIATDAANEGFYMAYPLYALDGHIKDFQFEDCNNRGAELVGTTKEKLIGTTLRELLPSEYQEDILTIYRQAMQIGFYEDEVRLSPLSPVKATWLYRRVVRSGNGLAVTLRDISETKEHEKALAVLANTDTLTKLPNRLWLSAFLPTKIQQEKIHNKHFAVLFLDLDNFKNINDTLGHDAGDELLKSVAIRLKATVRASDHVVRLGGDEFTIVLDQVDVVEDVSRVARMIINTITQPFNLLGSAGHLINVSIGISMFPQDGMDGETLLKHADIAMYAAKAAGKGRFRFYDTHLSDSLVLKLSKERALRQALEKDEFVIYYQPRVETQSGKLCSMEALVRWISPSHGLILPHDFIDLAEDTGMINQLGEQILQKVCAQIANWQKEQLSVVPVSINVAAAQLKTGKFYAYLSNCLEKYCITPELIEIEITESSVLEKSLIVTKELDQLRALGIALMIDDFGTGYSSLTQLHRLDVDALKVDHAFTSEVGTGGEGETIFKAIVSMASALKMNIVAEGVETPKQLECLKAMSCDQIQGYLISPPMPAKEAQVFLQTQHLLTA